jgi:hypothetical protein
MTTAIHTFCRVGADGRVVVPVGVEEAGTEVEVTIAPRNGVKRASEMTPKEHAAFIETIAGKWVGDFPEFPDPPPETRDPL